MLGDILYLATVKLLYNPRVNRVFTSLHFTSLPRVKTASLGLFSVNSVCFIEGILAGLAKESQVSTVFDFER